MNLPDRIHELHSLLNSEGITPELGFRRNSIEYELICYVNNVIGLVLAENYRAAAFFIRRAHNYRLELAQHGGTSISAGSESEYLHLVSEYLILAFKFAVAQSEIVSESFDIAQFNNCLANDVRIDLITIGNQPNTGSAG